MKWMPSLLKALVPDGDDKEQHYNLCFALIKVLRKLSVEAFEDAARTLSSAAVIKKMDPHLQIAACQAANFSYEQLRKFRRYLIKADLNILQPEYII
jgi:hypothetical protein